MLISCHFEETKFWAGVANGLPPLPASPRRIIRFQVAVEGKLLSAMAAEDLQVAERHIISSTHETGTDLGRGGAYGRRTWTSVTNNRCILLINTGGTEVQS